MSTTNSGPSAAAAAATAENRGVSNATFPGPARSRPCRPRSPPISARAAEQQHGARAGQRRGHGEYPGEHEHVTPPPALTLKAGPQGQVSTPLQSWSAVSGRYPQADPYRGSCWVGTVGKRGGQGAGFQSREVAESSSRGTRAW